MTRQRLKRWDRWPKPFIEEPYECTVDESRTWSVSALAVLLFSLSITGLATQFLLAWNLFWARLPAAFWFAGTIYIVVLRPRTASIPLFIDFCGILITEVSLHAYFLSGAGFGQPFWCSMSGIVVAIVCVAIMINMPLREPSLNSSTISKPYTMPTNALRSPEDNMTLYQWMTISWLTPLIKIGNQRQLNDEDVWLLAYEFQHRHLHNAFRELKGSVIRRLLVANWIDLALLTSLAVLELIANYSVPLILQKLLQEMENISYNKGPAITFGLLILIVRLIAAQSAVFSLWFGRRTYERARGEMITMLYEKTLTRKIVGGKPTGAVSLPPGQEDEEIRPIPAVAEETTHDAETNAFLEEHGKALVEESQQRESILQRVRRFFRWKVSVSEEVIPSSIGKIYNLMRNDVYEVAQRFWEFQTLINKPVGLILSIILLWRMLGWSCMIAVAVVIIAQLVNIILARILMSWEKKRRKKTDSKLQLISQYVESIRHLRWYGWHLPWLDGVMIARQEELNLRVVTFIWNALIKMLNSLAAGMIPVATFYGYTILAGKELRVDVAFPAIQLFALVQANLREIPGLVTVLLNASVAVGRIEDFMAEGNKGHNLISESIVEENVQLQNASFSWPGLTELVLVDLTLSLPMGLTVVYGPVAAGKTALLQALLGELELRKGKVIQPQGAVGYCSQTPWLQSMSIRENILFFSPFEEARYKKTLDVCALLPDLANFKHGDLSNIGENGIGLSGGQKARVALARAVYSRAQTLLLDDPLSALDQQTAEWIVERCLTGSLMLDRRVVLVTHRVDLCRDQASQLVEISHGKATIHRNNEDFLENDSTANETLTQPHTNTSVEIPDDSIDVPEKFEDEERRVHGGVQFAIYWQYARAGTLRWWFLVVVTAGICRITYLCESWFLKEWGEAYDRVKSIFLTSQMFAFELHVFRNPISGILDKLPDPADDVHPWLLGFALIVLAETVALVLSETCMLVVTYTAARRIFRDIMKSISNARFHFYDVNPVGRLMNRLTSDIGTIDGPIADQFLIVIWYGVSWVSSMIVIASLTPIFLIFALSLTLVFIFIFLHFLPTSQSLRRLEMVSLSPLMSNFGALLHGLMTVRAFCAQAQFQERNIEVTDAFQKMDHFYWSLQGWLMYRFDTLSAISTFLLTLLAIYSGLSPGLTAFVLVAAAKFVQSTHAICRQYGQLQLEFVSVERVVELLHVDQEPQGHIVPPAAWPTFEGDVIFENVTLRYQPHLPPALSNVSCRFKGGTSNAITGRTGSGKSTLALALLATVTPESGRILIDGIDISAVDKQILRTRITFLAQEPVLFPGTLRHNIDPMSEHSDTECHTVVSRICGRYGWTLETHIENGGSNLSQGQRQVVGLARAILRRSAIVIMDEATASIDLETSAEIQRILREELKESTIITIAHRAAAVENADFCLNLANGRVASQGKLGAQVEN